MEATAIYVVEEGQKPERAQENPSTGLLSTAWDSAMTVDLERQLKNFTTHHPVQTETWCHLDKMTNFAEVNRLLGGKDGGGSREEEGELPGAGRGLSEEWVDDQV